MSERKVYIMMLAMVAMLLIASLFTSCKKDNCFDQALYDEWHDKGCTTDCPGVVGCDGKTYCNECEANRNGIRVD